MKKLYSKKLGGEAFALDAAQLDILKKAGYTVPSPEEVIADAAAVKIEPPEGARAYVVFDFKTGAFTVRTRTQTLTDNEVGGFVGEVVSAAILSKFVERADPDRPKEAAPATPATASPLVNMLRAAFLRAASDKAPATDQAHGGGRHAGGRRMIKLGDRITVKPATFDVPGKDRKPKAIPGTVVYVHPAGRYCVLEFDVGRREPVTIRESFQLIDGRVAE